MSAEQSQLHPSRSERPLRTVDDAELVRLLRSTHSDECNAAGDEFLHRYGDEILRCMNVLKGVDADTRHEAALGAVAHIVEKLPEFEVRQGGSLAAWIRRVAYNYAVSLARDLQREPSFVTAIMMQTTVESTTDSPDAQASPSRERFAPTKEKALMKEVWKAARWEDRRLFHWRIVDKLTDREIAALLGVDEKRVPNMRHKAKKRMMDSYLTKEAAHGRRSDGGGRDG
jgi:DNA-directed RNA polymerase specialized sigma24 family protein